MTKEDLKKNIYKTSHLTGKFLLRSGQYSSEYFDKYRFESNPTLLQAIAKELKHLIPPETKILAGLEMGAIPIATALAIELNLPCVFVRKHSKKYGTNKVVEGIEVKGKNVCIIEDIITTGGQVLLSLDDLRNAGATVNTVVCVINRSPFSIQKFIDKNLQIKNLFEKKDFDALA
ncbi:MAG: orotate phosphoribosyltransferase [Bdellovibrionaceae bacterium]|nr:orotate phosphoribosyltransferase [Pseudobdellovibrionaceae bacterium]